MIIEFVGMSGAGKSTVLEQLRAVLKQPNQMKKQTKKHSITSFGFAVMLLVFLFKANLLLKPTNMQTRVKINERLLLACLKHYKNLNKEGIYKVVDEGIVHAILFSMDNRVKEKVVDYEKLVRAAQFLFKLEEVLVVFVDANEDVIVENRNKRNRQHNEKTKNLIMVQKERSRNDRKLQALEHCSKQLRYTYIDNSSYLEEDEILSLVNLIKCNEK